MTGRVLVLGSINADLVVMAPRLPVPGETVLGDRFERHPGGKGANQAVAASRAGASVLMLGAVGRDPEGRQGLDALAGDGVDVTHVRELDGPSGIALIAVGPGGENQIVVAPGANSLLTADHVGRALAEAAAAAPDVLLASFEVPMLAVEGAVRTARQLGLTIVVNPAPAAEPPAALLSAGAILTPNREELRRLTGHDDPEAGARSLLARGASAVIVTLGADGCVVWDAAGRLDLPAPVVEAVDTTGAGDTFSGVLAAWLADGSALADAARAATVAAALSVRSAGARAGMPGRDEILAGLAV